MDLKSLHTGRGRKPKAKRPAGGCAVDVGEQVEQKLQQCRSRWDR